MKLGTRLLLAGGDGTAPFEKFSSWLDKVNTYMGKIGPAIAGIAIAICVLSICLGDERKTKEQIKKIIIITIAVSLLANVTNLLDWGEAIVKYFLN